MHTAFKVLGEIPNLQFSWHCRRAFQVKVNAVTLCTLHIVALESCVYPHSKKAAVNSTTDFSHLSVSNLHLHKAILNRLHSPIVFMFIQVLSSLSWDYQQAQFHNWDLQNAPLFIRTDPISSKGLHLSDKTIKWAVAAEGKPMCN